MGPTPEPARASEAHPGLLQILDLLSNQPVTEAALQTFCLNHVAFRPICGPSVTTTKTQRGRVAPSKIRDSIAALFVRQRFFDSNRSGRCGRAVLPPEDHPHRP